jgi:hypothetical protein
LFFFVSGVLCAHHKNIWQVFTQTNNDNDEKIIMLALPTHKKYNNQPIMVTAVGGKQRSAQREMRGLGEDGKGGGAQ